MSISYHQFQMIQILKHGSMAEAYWHWLLNEEASENEEYDDYMKLWETKNLDPSTKSYARFFAAKIGRDV